MGGFGAQPAQGQGAPVIPNQAGYGMASYQTQWAGTLFKSVYFMIGCSFQWHSEDWNVDNEKKKKIFILKMEMFGTFSTALLWWRTQMSSSSAFLSFCSWWIWTCFSLCTKMKNKVNKDNSDYKFWYSRRNG